MRREPVHLGLVEQQVEDVQPAHDLDVLHRRALVGAGGDLAAVSEVPTVDVRVGLAAGVKGLHAVVRHRLQIVDRPERER